MSIVWLALKTIGSLFVVACALRVYLQLVRLHAQNPLSRLTFQMTDWIVLPMRRVIPGFRGFDWASFLAAVVLALALAVAFYLLTSMQLLSASTDATKPVRPFGWLVVLAMLWLAQWCLQLGMVIVVMAVVMSWLNPMHPIKPVFDLLAAPMLAPFHRLMGKRDDHAFGKKRPSGAGFDLSPIGAFLVLQIGVAVTGHWESMVTRHLF